MHAGIMRLRPDYLLPEHPSGGCVLCLILAPTGDSVMSSLCLCYLPRTPHRLILRMAYHVQPCTASVRYDIPASAPGYDQLRWSDVHAVAPSHLAIGVLSIRLFLRLTGS